MCQNSFTIIQHTILDVILPTTDTFSDINFAISAFSTKNYQIGAMLITPVILNLLFNLYLWKTTDFDTQDEKRYTWIIVILSLWPQYQMLKLLVAICKNKSETTWKQKERRIKLEISYIEPFIEAIPQYFISLGVYTMMVSRTNEGSANINTFFTEIWSKESNNETPKVFGKYTLGISNTYMFPISLGISFLTGIKSVVDYLQNGPLTIASENKYCNAILFVAKLVYVSTEFLNKLVICWSTSFGYGGEVVGIVISLSLFIYYIFIPSAYIIGPMARYLGLKRLTTMYLKNPQLLVLPLVTDLNFGPINGYKRCCCRSDCCCGVFCCCFTYIGLYWCCPCCCCDACRFEEGCKITISKQMSWAKMGYISILLLGCEVTSYFRIGNHPYRNFIWISFNGLVILGRVAFIIVLHAGNSFGVLTLPSLDTAQCRQNDVHELHEISHKRPYSLDERCTKGMISSSFINERTTRCHSFP
jgi:hypothetical protein